MMIIMGKIMMVNEQMLHTHTPKSQIKKRLGVGVQVQVMMMIMETKKTMILVP